MKCSRKAWLFINNYILKFYLLSILCIPNMASYYLIRKLLEHIYNVIFLLRSQNFVMTKCMCLRMILVRKVQDHQRRNKFCGTWDIFRTFCSLKKIHTLIIVQQYLISKADSITCSKQENLCSAGELNNLGSSKVLFTQMYL